MPPRDRRSTVLGSIRNPLVFFSLVLLVIEGIFGIVVATSKMSGGYQFAALCLMVVVVLVVVAAVTWITIRWPQHLYEDIIKDIRSARRTAELLGSDAFRDAVERVVLDVIRKPPEGTQSPLGEGVPTPPVPRETT